MGSSLDDVLALDTETVLSRRLQTLVYLKGFSSTPYQARQLISHGHVAVKGKKITVPGYMVGKEEEGQITYTIRSPLNEISHPARPKVEMYKSEMPVVPPKEKPLEKPLEKPIEKPGPAASKPEPAPQPASVQPAPIPATPQPLAQPKQEPSSGEKPAEKPKEHKKKEKKEEGS